MKYWISSKDVRNEEFLRSVDVTLGPRKGDYWHDCDIPETAFKDLDENWGELFWGEEEEEPRSTALLIDTRVRKKCPHCRCNLREDGSCSYPLCKPRALERKARLRTES